MNPFLSRLEEAVKGYLKETYLPPHRARTPGWNRHDLDFFARGAELLSTAFTEERKELPRNYFNKKEFRSAYLLYFTLINAAKVFHCLSNSLSPLGGEGRVRGPIKILDLGAGPLTASLACSSFFADRPIEILAVEQNRYAALDGLNLWKKMGIGPKHRLQIKTIEVHPKNLSPLLRGNRFDLAIAANFLSELPLGTQFDLAAQTLHHSNALIIIEPALRNVTRELMRLRDHLVAEKCGEVLAPCLHQCNCPMLAANNRDWCHFYIDWKCPGIIRDVDGLIGNRHDYLKMAYMIFSSKSLPFVRGGEGRGRWRVVSSSLVSAGKREFILCGANGRLQKVCRLNKDKSESNRMFDRLQRGDIVEWSGGERIEKTGVIKQLKSF